MNSALTPYAGPVLIFNLGFGNYANLNKERLKIIKFTLDAG